MYVLQPFSRGEGLLRMESDDLGRILAEPHFVGRHGPVEGYDAASPQCVL